MTHDRDALIELDRALDELAAGAPAAAAPAAGAAALAGLAAELRAAVPAPPEGAADRGRAALLAAAGAPLVAGAGAPPRRGATRRRRLARARLLAAALLLAVAVPAALAGRALPGTPLWPLRQAGQQVRLGLTADPVQRAHLRLNTAAMLLGAAGDAGGYRRAGLAACREQIQAAMAQLGGQDGPEAAAERARAEDLLAGVDDLERSTGEDGGRSGRGGGRSDGPGGSGGPGESGDG